MSAQSTDVTPETRRPLLILHGVNGCRTEMTPWSTALSDAFDVQSVNLAGHGGRRVPDVLTMEAYADDLLGQMDTLGLARPLVLGYSFGGLVGLHLAIHHPDRVAGIITVATQWLYDADAVRHVTHLLRVSRLAGLPHRRDHLSRVHYPNDWRLLAKRLGEMYASFEHDAPLTPDQLQRITCPCLVLSGSSDPVTPADETVALHRSLPRSTIAMYPGVAHPPDRVPVGGLQRAIMKWHAAAFE